MGKHLPPLTEAGLIETRAALYDAVGEFELLPVALNKIGSLMGASSVCVGLPFFEPGADYTYDAVTTGIDFTTVQEYARQSQSTDPWTENTVARGAVAADRIYLGRAMCTSQEIRRSHWFEPIFKPMELGEVMIGTFTAPSGVPVDVGSCVIHRPMHWEPYDEDGARRLSMLIPDIARVARAAFALRAANRRNAVFSTVVDQLSSGIIILGRDRSILYANALAERFLSEGLGFRCENKSLSSSDEKIRGAILHAFADATAKKKGTDIPLPRAGRTTCLASFSPLTEWVVDRLGVVEAYVLVVIRDPEVSAGHDHDALKRTFDLTEAEARIAVAIAQGKSPADIAQERGTSRETVRAQLKSVFSKTHTGRQAELASLIAGVSSS